MHMWVSQYFKVLWEGWVIPSVSLLCSTYTIVSSSPVCTVLLICKSRVLILKTKINQILVSTHSLKKCLLLKTVWAL